MRPAQLGDLPTLGNIWRQMMAEHVALHPAFALAEDALERWWGAVRTMLSARDSFVFVATRLGEPVGFCTGRVAHNPDIYEVQRVGLLCELAVAPEARRQQVGAALVVRARNWFVARGLSEFQLSTALGNEAGRAFWRAMGGKELLVRFRFSLF